MELIIDFPGGKRVDAHFGAFTVSTDQPAQAGGEDSAPTPFATFLASIGTCAGIYVLGFCQARGIPTEGLTVTQRSQHDPETKRLVDVTIEVGLPQGFPEKYREAVLRAAENCKVKKTIEHPPTFTVRAA